ncbi:MAG TPA: hypothetical protein VF175_14900, partial [Lacipirellula sp.]
DGTMTFTELTANAGVISATNGDGLQFNNADGAYTFNDAVLLVNDPGEDAGIDVTNGSSGTFSFTDTANIISNTTGDALVIQGSDATFTYEGSITTDAASGRPINISNNTGGSITIASTVTSTGEGILVEDNSGGTILFDDQVTLTTTTNDAVNILDNTGGSVQFNNIDITTTSGRGFVATSTTAGSTVTVTGNDNNIETTTGTALQLDTIAAGGSGINFESVSSDGAANAIIIEDVTGGQVSVGAGVAAGAGGTINASSGAAIQITNAANVSLNQMVVSNTAAGFNNITVMHNNATTSTVSITNFDISGGLDGIAYSRSATATSRITLNNNTIDTIAQDGISMDIGGTGTANVTITNNNVTNTTLNQEALSFNTSGGLNKTVNLLVDGNTLVANTTGNTANFTTNGAGTLNATVTDNVMSNGGAGRAFAMESINPTSTIRLNLNNNTAVSGNANEYLLDETGGDFRVLDLADVDARNNGDIEFQPLQTDFTDDPGPIPTP